MDVNYGQAVKQYLTERVELIRIHRFRPADVQFSDALVSSAIAIFRKTQPTKGHRVQMSLGGSLTLPDRMEMVALDSLRTARKWTRFSRADQGGATERDSLTLGDLFTIKRGLATGANRFFILTEELAGRLGIPAQFKRPILPNPRHVSNEVIESDESGYPTNTIRLALIDCDLPEEEIALQFPEFWRYLQSGKREDIHNSYLASRRSPWYSQEKREAAPFLFNYMGRHSSGRQPFRVIWNKSAATAHNVYLLLYPKGPLKKALERDPGLQAVVFLHLRSLDTNDLLREGRVYGGGLHKLEPNELARVPAQALWEAVAGPDAKKQVLKTEQLAIAW